MVSKIYNFFIIIEPEYIGGAEISQTQVNPYWFHVFNFRWPNNGDKKEKLFQKAYFMDKSIIMDIFFTANYWYILFSFLFAQQYKNEV
jgi:hypothetical protein